MRPASVAATLLLAVAAATASPAPNKSAGGGGDDLSPSSRVINGEPVTSADEWPFVVDLSQSPDYISKSRFCTGTLIAADVVLTAAHCVLNGGDTGEGTFATMGRINLADGHADNNDSETIRAVAAVAHPGYRGLGSPADVALLLLERGSSKEPVALAAAPPDEGATTSIVGYGVRAIGTVEASHAAVEVLPRRLQKTQLRIEARAFCDAAGGGGGPVTAEGMLCTSGLRRGSSACRGDSGGGLFSAPRAAGRRVQVGVVSYGDAECMSEDAGVFTDVSAVRGWVAATAARLAALPMSATPVTVPASGRALHAAGAAAPPAERPAGGHGLRYFRVTAAAGARRVAVSACVRGGAAPRLFAVGGGGGGGEGRAAGAAAEGGAPACADGAARVALELDAAPGGGSVVGLAVGGGGAVEGPVEFRAVPAAGAGA